MPVITCGGMRAQMKWGPDADLVSGEVEVPPECQVSGPEWEGTGGDRLPLALSLSRSPAG